MNFFLIHPETVLTICGPGRPVLANWNCLPLEQLWLSLLGRQAMHMHACVHGMGGDGDDSVSNRENAT